ncbi:NUDIX hydrolase [Microlunatus flavus]|uniref:ADP-ribose pyrophosphatase YjhB, NUDIX family n=1 Tax=Microlunatus flavus TaxID=1036181 RepID=A0A1H9J1N1_9ACTN|nr:NUDIX hydrolase [Microlunatus flavus]SEQ80698.1 ADP-ribose pyrophosphatase YjhB, NUDIX family [Microlunatus flavus]
MTDTIALIALVALVALVVLVALVEAGRLLLGHRHPGRRWYPDCWDLVGGHCEAGESPEEAARRECREEVGVDVGDLRRLEVHLDDAALVAHAFLATSWPGTLTNLAPDEHDDLRWFGVADLPRLRRAHPSYRRWLPRVLAEVSGTAAR